VSAPADGYNAVTRKFSFVIKSASRTFKVVTIADNGRARRIEIK
jgi:hypothetical protein